MEVPAKIVVRLKATGNAPILKQSIFKISSTYTFEKVIAFLTKELQQQPFCYINSSFAPSPDELLSNLYQSFGVDKSLIVNYSITPAWG